MSENHGKRRREIGSDSSPFDSFPEDCICKIVSCTSPRDACVVATVSKAFESAAKSDVDMLYGRSFFRPSMNPLFLHRVISHPRRSYTSRFARTLFLSTMVQRYSKCIYRSWTFLYDFENK
ncbi:unnamed protein product [Brassica oleracea]|uniref:(rape) hypothetical protein n=1 Tax=Brassica napus TaxID=3708 RepID=A0A816MHI5_BRANA|nr:unnamed protein product [Brassica napus]